MRHDRFIWPILLSFFCILSCKNQADLYESFPEKFSAKTLHPTTQKILKKIWEIEYSDKQALGDYVQELMDTKDPLAEKISQYYRTIIEYYESNDPNVINQLDVIYEDLTEPELEFLKVEIDVKHYKRRFTNESKSLHNLVDLNKFQNVVNYMNKPGYSIPRDYIVATVYNNMTFLNTEAKINEIEFILKRLENTPWNIYHALFHQLLAEFLVETGEEEKIDRAISVLQKAAKTNLKHRLIMQSYEAEFMSNFYAKNTKRMILSLQKLEEIGYTQNVGSYYINLGNCHYEDGEYAKAKNAYKKAVNFTTREDWKSDYQLALSLISVCNVHLEPQYFENHLQVINLALNNVNPENHHVKFKILQKKQEVLYYLYGDHGDPSTLMAIDSLQAILDIKNQSFLDNKKFSLYNLDLQNDHLYQLSWENQLKTEKISRRQTVLISLFVLLLFLIFIIYNHRLSNQATTTLNSKQLILEEQNKNLKYYVSQLKESNRQIQQYTSLIAHDLKNPLGIIFGLVNNFKNNYAQDFNEYDHENTHVILDSCSQIKELINGVYTYTSLNGIDTQTEIINIKKLITSITSKLQAELIDKKLTLNVQPNIPLIEANYDHMFLLFYNLIHNSIKFSKVPHIIVDITLDQSDPHFFNIIVKDNGQGTEVDKHRLLFELFYKYHTSIDFDGNGIGLAICKRIMEIYNGSIAVSEKQNKGFEVICSFPKEIIIYRSNQFSILANIVDEDS